MAIPEEIISKMLGGTKVTPKATPKLSAAETANIAGKAAVKNPTVANINTFIKSLEVRLAEKNVEMGLNSDGTKKPVVEKPLTRMQMNEQNEAGGPPGAAPQGFVYKFNKSVEGGYWKLYATSTGGGGKVTDNTTTIPATPSTSVDVLKALLKAQGFSSKIVDTSATYLNSLLKDNLDYDNAIEVFLNTKDYTLKNGTKITSPFYTEYGYLNEGLATPKQASELFNAVEGYKGLQQKYGFSDTYLSVDNLKKYVKNNVTVDNLDERANTARLASITTDAAKTDAFIKLGYIADASGLQDFYMDSAIGKEQLETNRNTGAFVAEAIRRNSTGIATGATQLADFRKIAAELTAKGYSEGQISAAAATGFENIGKDLGQVTALSGIFEKTGGTVESNATIQNQIQSELVQEEFGNMASARRKRLEEQNIRSFQGRAGLTSSSLNTGQMQ